MPISEVEAIADKVGVPFGTLHKIKYGQTKFPRFDTVQKLSRYFRRRAPRAA